MNAIELAQKAYAPASFHLKTERSVEAQAIGRITARLRSAGKNKSAHFPKLVEALHENRKLWSAFAADVVEQGNSLPDQLRAQIFYLAEFTEQHSAKVLRDEADVEILVEINTSIMRGLNTQRAK